MSPQDKDKKPSGKARERAAAAYAADRAKARRRRQFLIGGIVVVVIAIAVGIGVAVQHNSSRNSSAAANGPLVFPTGTVASGLAVPYGTNQNAKVTLTVYEDFRCPFCKEAESMFGPIYTADAKAGKIKVQFHFVNLIDRNDGGTGSIQAGSAAGCAQDAGNEKFKSYHDVLYANQPSETDDAYASTDTLISLAKKVSGLDTPAFEACVKSGKYQPWVVKNYDALSSAEGGNVSTPDYLINGQSFELTSQPAATQEKNFANALDKAVAAAG
jgi:protein-disulfide isomerase